MTVLIDVLIAVFLAVLNFVLVRLISPVRVGLLARLIRGKDENPMLQIAVQNLHVSPVEGPVKVDVLVEHPGALPSEGTHIWFYGGPEAGAPGVLKVQRTNYGLSILIGRMRGFKTWTFEIPCARATRRVHGVLFVPRRPLGELLGFKATATIERALGDPALVQWKVESDYSDPQGLKVWRTFNYESSLVLVLLLLSGLACYFAFVVTATEGPDDVWRVEFGASDIFIVVTFVVVVCALFFITRPRWYSIAQGYLERQDFPLSNDPGSQK